MDDILRVLMEDIRGRSEEPLPDLPIEPYPNSLEQAILNRAMEGTWYRTTSGNEAFTLSYGELTHRSVSEYDCSPEGALPCCWSDDCGKLVPDFPLNVEGRTNYVVFKGKHFATIHSGNFPESSHTFTFGENGVRNPTIEEQYGDRLQTIITSDETTYLRKCIWKTYLYEKELTNCICPEIYSDILRPELYTALEEKFDLNGGQWYLLPSDCYTCT